MGDYSYLHDIGYQYTYGSTAFLIYLMVLNYAELKPGFRNKVLAIAAASSIFMFMGNTYHRTEDFKRYKDDKQTTEKIDNALELIPKDSSIAASTFLVPALYDCREVYELDTTKHRDSVEYIVIDLRYSSDSYSADNYINDPNYEAFTPRTVNARNKEKINELKVQQKNIIKEKSELQNKLYDVQRRLEECQSIIQCVREKETIAQQYQEEDNAEYKIQLLEAQEMERQRIARDLHDSTVQDLTSMLHKIELSMRVMDMDSQRCKMELSNVLDNIRNVISNTRKMIYNLRPMSVDDIGIDVTLKHAIAKIEQEWNRKIEYIIIGNLSRETCCCIVFIKNYAGGMHECIEVC